MSISDQDRDKIRLLGDISELSHDPDRQVGVAIMGSSGDLISTGANGPPAVFGYRVSDSHAAILRDPAWKYYMLEHAERNAIMAAHISGVSLRGSTLYGSLFPCADCARAIVAAGVRRVVVPTPGVNPTRDEKWREHYVYAQQIFDLAGVVVDFWLPSESR